MLVCPDSSKSLFSESNTTLVARTFCEFGVVLYRQDLPALVVAYEEGEHSAIKPARLVERNDVDDLIWRVILGNFVSQSEGIGAACSASQPILFLERKAPSGRAKGRWCFLLAEKRRRHAKSGNSQCELPPAPSSLTPPPGTWRGQWPASCRLPTHRKSSAQPPASGPRCKS